MRPIRIVLAVTVAASAMPTGTARAQELVRLDQFGTDDAEAAYDAVVRPDGSVFVVGLTSGAFEGFTGAGLEDAFVRGYRPDGSEAWTRQFGTAGEDIATAVSADGNGALYVVGATNGQLTGASAHGGWDTFVRKYRPGGAIAWTKQLGAAGFDAGSDVAVHGSSVYVTMLSDGRNTAQLRRYSLRGALRWTRQVPAGWHLPVAADASGIYIGGTLEVPDSSELGYDLNVFLRKYAHEGTRVWTRRFGTSGIEQPLGLTVGGGALYVSGHTRGALGAEPQGLADAFVRTFTTAGSVVWTRQWGTAGTDIAWAAAVTETGASYVVGLTETDAFTAHLDGEGTTLWTEMLSTDASDEARGVALAGTSLSVVGSTGGRLDGSHGAPTGADAFLATYSV